MSYIYLASAYSDPDPAVRHARYLEAERATVWLLNKQHWVYSPIVHCHNLAVNYKLPTDISFWHVYNSNMLEKAGLLCILVTEGVRASKGVSYEISHAQKLKIDIILLFPKGENDYTLVFSLEDIIDRDPFNLLGAQCDTQDSES